MCHELPQETNVKPLVRISPSQKQDSPAHFTEQFSTDSSNEGDISCETLIDSETSEGDSSGKTCSYSQNLSEESDDEVQEIFRPYPIIFHLGFLDVQWKKLSDIL